jgi:UDP-glucose 4-epimerase
MTRNWLDRPPSNPVWKEGPRRWLVTGGAGFIGSHLVDALVASGDEVRVIDNLSTGRIENIHPKARLFHADVADRDAVSRAMAGVEGCFHLAAIASVERGNQDWIGTHRANLTGTIVVFDAARERNVPVVYASSAAVYGACEDAPITEDAPTRPLSAYGADKLGCELHARVARTVHGMRVAGLRFFNVYGPRQDPASPYSGVISIFWSRISAREGILIHGDGRQTRDFVYVDDVSRALVMTMTRLPQAAPVMNVCTGRPTSVLELASLVAALQAKPLSIRYVSARTGDVRTSLGNPSLAVTRLGFTARTRLRDGLRQMMTMERRVVRQADTADVTQANPEYVAPR